MSFEFWICMTGGLLLYAGGVVTGMDLPQQFSWVLCGGGGLLIGLGSST